MSYKSKEEKSVYMRDYRDGFLKAGICVRCRKRQSSINCQQCEICREEQRKRKEVCRRLEGVCQRKLAREYRVGEVIANQTLLKKVKEVVKIVRRSAGLSRNLRVDEWLCRCSNCKHEEIYKEQTFRGWVRKGGACVWCNLQPKGYSGFNALLFSYKAKARERGYCWNLSDEQFGMLTSGNCAYCGISPYKIRKTYNKHSTWGDYLYNGVDREHNDTGYFFDNCVSCCWECQTFKQGHSLERWLSFLERIRES